MPDKKKIPVLKSIIIFLALKPLYLFESGGLQLCDMFLAITIIYSLVKSRGKISLTGNRTPRLIMLMVLYQLIVNLSWFAFYHDSRFLSSSLFYIYNAVAFFYFLDCGRRGGLEPFKQSCAYGVLISSLVTVVGLFINQGTHAREMGFFNNPNQLGLHGVLMLSVLYFVRDNISKVGGYIVVLLSLVIIFASASKAALLAVVFLLLVYVLYADRTSTRYSKMRKVFLIVVFGVGVYALFYSNWRFISNNLTIMYMRRRIFAMSSESDSNLALGRGYARIGELGSHFLWGLGEGAYNRFSVLPNHEVHSSFANIVCSYGVIGAIGYLCIWVNLFKDNKRTLFNILGFSGVILYSITHNSIRNTLVWLLLALLLLEKTQNDSLSYKPSIELERYNNG